MTGEKRVGDIMGLSLPVEVDVDCSMGKLAAILVQVAEGGNFDPVIVIKKGQSIIGMMGLGDLLDHLDPPYTKDKIKMEIFWEGLFTQRWKEISGQQVKRFMRSPVVVDASDNLMKVAHVMNSKKVGTVLVARNGKLAGIVSMVDLLNEMLAGDKSCEPGAQDCGHKNIVNG